MWSNTGESQAIVDELDKLTERLRRLHGMGKPAGEAEAEAVAPVDVAPTSAQLIEVARSIVASRKLRRTLFGNVPFADPAWDIMLDVTICELEQRRVAVSSVCIAAMVPNSTALRWVGDLVSIGILQRWADPADGRRNFVGLTDQARRAMHKYLGARIGEAHPID